MSCKSVQRRYNVFLYKPVADLGEGQNGSRGPTHARHWSIKQSSDALRTAFPSNFTYCQRYVPHFIGSPSYRPTKNHLRSCLCPGILTEFFSVDHVFKLLKITKIISRIRYCMTNLSFPISFPKKKSSPHTSVSSRAAPAGHFTSFPVAWPVISVETLAWLSHKLAYLKSFDSFVRYHPFTMPSNTIICCMR